MCLYVECIYGVMDHQFIMLQMLIYLKSFRMILLSLNLREWYILLAIGTAESEIKLITLYMEIDDPSYVPDHQIPRLTPNRICNSFGNKMLELCRATNFRIMADYFLKIDSKGFTYANEKGSSIIDMLICKECDFHLLNNFIINDFNEFSDHASISFSLKCRVTYQHKIKTKEVRLKWDDSNKIAFRNGIISNLSQLNNLVYDIDLNSRDSVNNTINEFTEILK